ncbi:MAG: neprosin family prolyl endopeptidase [Alphaproteobacteria bacterium]|nr:neprosin family prolyl endopeptidase [Alphaproteobacteria bacterium]
MRSYLANLYSGTLSSFRSLEEFFSKDHRSDSRIAPMAADTVAHRYAVLQRKSDTGNWWVRMNGVWVGYYPAALFADGTFSQRPASRRRAAAD